MALGKLLVLCWYGRRQGSMLGFLHTVLKCVAVQQTVLLLVSDEPIGSPVFETNIDIVIAMNVPSYLKYVDKVAPGGVPFH